MPHGCASYPCHRFLLPTSSSLRERSCCLHLSWKEQGLPDRNNGSRIRCVLYRTSAGVGDYEAAEPRRPPQEHGNRLNLKLEVTEEEEGGGDLTEMERGLFSEHSGLICVDEELKRRERLMVRQERLVAEVKNASSSLVSQASVIEGLKLRLGDRGQHILDTLSAATMKEDEIECTRSEFMKRSERASMISGEIRSRALLLHETNALINEQEHELERLCESVRQKEEKVEASSMHRKKKEGELKAAESFLEERTREWLLALEELKQLVNETSRGVIDSYEALEGFRMLKRLVVDVRAELVTSRRSLASSRQMLEDAVHKKVLFDHTRELEEENEIIASYTASLKEARMEVESERIQLAVAEARHEELKRELAAEQQLIEEQQENLAGERVHLEEVDREISLLQAELDGRTMEFLETQEVLRVKESELVEAKLEIQRLDSEQRALWQMLEDEDFQLLNTRKEMKKAFFEAQDPEKWIDGKEATGIKLERTETDETVTGRTVDLLPDGQDQHLLSHPSSCDIEAAAALDLQKLTEACQQLLDRTDFVPDSSILDATESSDGSGQRVGHKITKEISQLMALSEQLIAEAELQ